MTKYLFILLVACGSVQKPDTLTLAPWVGVPVQKLEKHDYFKKLTLTITEKSGVQIRDYNQRLNYTMPNSCEAAKTCGGMGSPVDCHNLFEIQNDIIVEATREGYCQRESDLLPSP